MTDNENSSAPLNRQQKRAAEAEAEARKAKREAGAAAQSAPLELAPFSVAWCDASIKAQEQLVNQRYADWQQSLGALQTLAAMRDLALHQQGVTG